MKKHAFKLALLASAMTVGGARLWSACGPRGLFRGGARPRPTNL